MRTLVLILLGFALLLPNAALAQTQPAEWELTQSFQFAELPLEMFYPDGWFLDTNTPGAYYIVENEADFAALGDDDATTLPTGDAFQIVVASLEEVGLDPHLPLDDFVTILVESTGVIQDPNEPLVDLSLLGHRTVSIVGDGFHGGRPGIGTTWIQDGHVIVMSMSTSTVERRNELAFSWGFVLGSIRPITTFTLTDDQNMFVADAFGISFKHPAEWVNAEQGNAIGFYQNEIDRENELAGTGKPLTGNAFYIFQIPTTTLTADSTREEIIAESLAFFGLTSSDKPVEENIILGVPGYTSEITTTTALPAYVTAVLYNNTLYLIVTAAADEDSLQAFNPDLDAILGSITAIE